MQITPLFDRVLLKPEVERVSTAGIYIPQSTAERSHIMTVEAVAAPAESPTPAVTVGDRVVVHKYAGTELIVDNQKFFIVKQCDILAKLTESAKT